MHIDDALETARSSGFAPASTDRSELSWIDDWVRVAITLNEVLRSLGSEDPYPFVITDDVRGKLEFVNRLVNQPA